MSLDLKNRMKWLGWAFHEDLKDFNAKKKKSFILLGMALGIAIMLAAIYVMMYFHLGIFGM